MATYPSFRGSLIASTVATDGTKSGPVAVGESHGWSLSVNRELVDVTRFQQTSKRFLPLTYDWTCEGMLGLDLGDLTQRGLFNQLTSMTPQTITVRLSAEGTPSGASVSQTNPKYFQGDAYVQSASIANQKGAEITLSLSFQGTGDLEEIDTTWPTA